MISLPLPPGKLQVACWRLDIIFDVKIEILSQKKYIYRHVGTIINLLLS